MMGLSLAMTAAALAPRRARISVREPFPDPLDGRLAMA